MLTLSFETMQEHTLKADFHLPSIAAEEATPERKAPIRVKFEIPKFIVSGIQVGITHNDTLLSYRSHSFYITALKSEGKQT